MEDIMGYFKLEKECLEINTSSKSVDMDGSILQDRRGASTSTVAST